MTKETTRDYIEIDLDGPIDKAIATLRDLKKQHPNGEIELTSETSYGETYEKLYLRFERDKTPVEIELSQWQRKRHHYTELARAAAAFENEGATYPRAVELEELKAELGFFASPMASLGIFNGEVLAHGFNGARRRNGEWVLRSFMGASDEADADRLW